MPTKAVQQFMLGTVLGNENEARQTLAAMKAAGYDGIELCGFMIHPIGFMVRLLTKGGGMPVGKGGNLDWHALVKEDGAASRQSAHRFGQSGTRRQGRGRRSQELWHEVCCHHGYVSL